MKLEIDLADYDKCPPYNEWLDESYFDQSGTLEILGFQRRPSRVLFSLSQDTYQAAFADFQTERQEELSRIVDEEFPAPISALLLSFRERLRERSTAIAFLAGYVEAIVDVLHGITIAECRFRGIALADPVKCKNILTDSVAQRLQNIELIVVHAQSQGVTIGDSTIVTSRTIQAMRELNQTRNGFSHSAAQSRCRRDSGSANAMKT